MNKSESIASLAGALAKAQAEIENASKNAANPHFKSKYADLAEVLNTARPVLAKHGLSVSQWPGFADGVVTLETLLAHSSGEWISNVASAPIGKLDAQGVGSALTYLRRYSLAAVAGIAQEDDDGNGAVKRPAVQPIPAELTQAAKLGVEAFRSAWKACKTRANVTPDQLAELKKTAEAADYERAAQADARTESIANERTRF